MAVKSGYVNGSDLLLTIGEDGKALGHCTSHRTTITCETKDRAVKPLKSVASSSGLFKSKTITGINITITADGLICSPETECGYGDLTEMMKLGEPVHATCIERGKENPYLEGDFVITSLEQDAPAGDDATYSITLENDGALTGWDDSAVIPGA